MPNSLTARMDVYCPHCDYDFSTHLWVIVDLDESPELVPSIRNDTIHYISCSRCGHGIGQADTPLLIYRPGYRPPVLFSPAWDTTPEDLKESSSLLMSKLQQSLGASLQDCGIAVVFRPRLGELLTADLGDAP